MTTVERLIDPTFVIGEDGKIDVQLCDMTTLEGTEKELMEMVKTLLVKYGSLKVMIEDIARSFNKAMTLDSLNALLADEVIKAKIIRKFLCKLDTILIVKS